MKQASAKVMAPPAIPESEVPALTDGQGSSSAVASLFGTLNP